jgi:hypothetical protein
MRFRDRLLRFFAGRNGSDQLSNFLMITYFVIFVVCFFVDEWTYFFLNTANMALLIYVVFRTFSRNIYKRRAENAKFLGLKLKVVQWFKRSRNKWKYRKTHVYVKCPFCKTDLRLPKKKGTHSVNCPKCYKVFKVEI